MALTDIVSTWRKGNVGIWLTSAIDTAPSSSATFVFRNVGVGPWPRSGKKLLEFDQQHTGYPLRDINDYKLGIVRPAFQLVLPFTETAFGFAMISLLQNKTAASADASVVLYSDPNVKWFFGMVAGFGATIASRRAYGCIVKKVAINIPPSGADGGKPTLTLDCIGAYCDRSYSAHGTSVLTEKPCISSDWSFKIGGVAKKFVSAELSIDNQADWSPHIGANADMLNVGKAQITGSTTLAVSLGASDEWDTINSNFEAGTSLDFEFDFSCGSNTHTIKIPVVFEEEPGEPSEQGAIAVAKCDWKGIYKDADEPGILLDNLLSTYSAWS